MQTPIYFLLLLLLGSSCADFLQNPDFETPPLNLPGNSSSSPFVLLNANNTIPGWTFEGTVQYVTSGDGHGLQLGQDAKITQTFASASDFLKYLLTFNLAPGGPNCSTYADVIVSAPNSQGLFSYKQHYGKDTLESYGHYLGVWGGSEPIHLEIMSQTSESDANSSCWPVIGALHIKTMNDTIAPQDNDNLILNGGFEFGPDFVSNSSGGVLLNEAPTPVQSPLPEWSVMGTVKYIDSDHYFVPGGNAAIELVSGDSSGVQAAASLKEGSSYSLAFTVGDANDSCVGEFVVGAQVGAVVSDYAVKNVTLLSNGTGSSQRFSLAFRTNSPLISTITFMSYNKIQTKDGVLCGPVLDDVVLRATSGGRKLEMQWKTMLVFLFLGLVLL